MIHGAQKLMRIDARLASRARALVLGSVAFLLTACALPTQQLSLPGPIGGPSGGTSSSGIATGSIGSGSDRQGVPLSGANRASREPVIIRGTGTFTNAQDQPGADAKQGADAHGDRKPGASRSVASESSDGITLNLAGASIPEVAKSVLGDVLGLNYSVSDAVKGSITLQTSRPIPRQELLQVFETLIRGEGAAIKVENGLYRIVPSDGSGGAPLRRRGGGSPGGIESAVIPLRYVSPEEMQRILTSLAPQSSVVKVEQSRNILIVSGTQSEIASIRDTVGTFDVDWMRGMSFGIFPLESADPESIAQELDTVFANDRASPSKGVVRFVPNRRLKAVLVITSRPEFISTAEKWVKRLDKVGQENEKQVHVYHVQNRPASELAALLQKVYTPQQGRPVDGRAPVQPGAAASTLSSDGAGLGSLGQPREASGEPRPIIPPFTPFPVPLQPAATPPGQPQTPAETATLSQPGTSGGPTVQDDRMTGIQVVSDEANNSLIITATKPEFQRVRKILSRIDVAAAQVLLEATIAEVTLNDQLRFGLRWFFERGQSQFSLTDAAAGAVLPRFPGFSYFLNTPNVQVALNALSDVTDVNIVSSPTLTVLDNKKAVLQVGDEVPVATQSAVSVVSPGAPIVNSVTFRNTGVILGITPRIGDNGRVLLDIEQEVSDVTPTTSSNIDSPTIRQRRIKTTVAVTSGESIILAGFMQDRASKARQQVPLLGNVPVVGNLFKDKNDEIKRTELLIAITPQVITDTHQIRGIAAEFRDRINLTTRPQRQAPPDRHEQIDRTLVR